MDTGVRARDTRKSADEAAGRGRAGAWLARRRWRMLLAGALLTVLAVPVALGAESRMTSSQFVAQTEAATVDRMLDEEFRAGDPHMVVLARAAGGVDAAGTRTAVRSLTTALRHRPGVTQVRSYWDSGHPRRLRSKDGRTGLLLVRLRGEDEDRAARAGEILPLVSDARWGPLRLSVTGEAAVQAALKEQMQHDLVRAELIALPGALVLLILAFGSVVAALLPLGVGVLTILGALSALSGLAAVVDVSVFSLNLVTAVGLGLAIDYSLFITTRFREQLAHGDSVPTAVATAVATAGRTVWFSALTVAFAFAAPLVFPSMRSLAYAGILVTLLAAVVATTVLPAVLALLGSRVTRLDPLRRWHRTRPLTAHEGGFWYRLARAVMRKPVPVALAVVALLTLLAAPFLHARFGLDDDRALPAGHAVHAAGERQRTEFAAAGSAPVTVVLKGFDPSASAPRKALADYARRVSALPAVRSVTTVGGAYAHGRLVDPAGRGADAPYRARAGTWLEVATTAGPYTRPGTRLVRRLRALPAPVAPLVGGAAAELVDTEDELLARMPWALAVIGVTTFVLLFLFTGGLLIPIKAIVLNLLSLTATFGSLVYVFQEGHLRWLVGDFDPSGYIDVGMPILIFFVAFGLSMDYEVFLLSRIAEEYAVTGDNGLAVARGLQRTGRLITAAAALFAAVLIALATSGVSSLKTLGVGLALAVVLDATLVRALLVPALMRLLGRANWWSPAPLRRFAGRLSHGDRTHDAGGLSGGEADPRRH
ncbi:MMPL family transporter [Streptomyces asiaticus]|uniref:MMPL family transporter n=1 Tax=Streptomyces asiaticus TaxID=114695 RepID=UPI003F6742EC